MERNEMLCMYSIYILEVHDYLSHKLIDVVMDVFVFVRLFFE